MKLFAIFCLAILSQGGALRQSRRGGLSYNGMFFKVIPEFQHPSTVQVENSKVKYYWHQRQPAQSNQRRRSPMVLKEQYTPMHTKNMGNIVGHMNVSIPTMIFVHGFMEERNPNVITKLISELKDTGRWNIILLDWHTLSAGPWYPWAVFNVRAVGRHLAKFIDKMAAMIDNENNKIQRGTRYRIERKSSSSQAFFKNLHVVGFSLGAHVAGIAGHHVTLGRIGRITAIEPANPLIDLLTPGAERIDASDAEFVDVIHTCIGRYGTPGPDGHVDFYPNGGKAIQPGCENEIAKYSCSHWKAWDYFSESMLNPNTFKALPCESWKQFEAGLCKRNQTDYEEQVYMGLGTKSTVRGTYYLRTHSSPPYSIA